jgi:hypothetical protein
VIERADGAEIVTSLAEQPVDGRQSGELQCGLLGRRQQLGRQPWACAGIVDRLGPASAHLGQHQRALLADVHRVEDRTRPLGQPPERDRRSRTDAREPLVRTLGHALPDGLFGSLRRA